MLKTLLTKETVQFKTSVSNWEEAIQYASSPLLYNKSIDERYVETMIQNVHEFGPYIVLMPKIAMPHARPEDGVNKLSISLLVLEEAVSFNEEKEANIFLVLAANDASSHLTLLTEISALLSNQEKVDTLLTATNYTDLLSIFEGE